MTLIILDITKPNLIIVLLYIERILSFLLRHKMYVLKVCANSFFSSGSLSFFFHVISKQLLSHLRCPFRVLCVSVDLKLFFPWPARSTKKTWKSCFRFFTDGEQHKPRELDMIAQLEIMHRGHTWHDYPWPWVSLTWLLCNLQLDDVPGADFENSLYAFGQSEKR